MKKKLLGFATLALALIALPAAAQQPENCNENGCEAGVCTYQGKATKQGKKARKDGSRRFNPFDGIQLTDAQKAGLEAITKQRQVQKQSLEAQKRTQKLKADSARFEQRKQGRRNYIYQVKEVLTPEQYVVFLENIVVNNPDKKFAPSMQRDGKNKKFDKGEKPGKPGKPDKNGKKRK